MNALRVLSFDPGVTTGYAQVYWNGNRFFPEVVGELFAIRETEEVFKRCSYAAVVAEEFTLIPKKAVEVSYNDPYITTCRQLGAMELLCQQRGMMLRFQMPFDKDGCPDEELRRLGLWNPEHSPHIRDALRHAVIYVRRQQRATGRREERKNRNSATLRDKFSRRR